MHTKIVAYMDTKCTFISKQRLHVHVFVDLIFCNSVPKNKEQNRILYLDLSTYRLSSLHKQMAHIHGNYIYITQIYQIDRENKVLSCNKSSIYTIAVLIVNNLI